MFVAGAKAKRYVDDQNCQTLRQHLIIVNNTLRLYQLSPNRCNLQYNNQQFIMFSNWNEHGHLIDPYVLCSNWLSMNEYFKQWFLKTIRPEAIDPELCLQTGTSSNFKIQNENEFEDTINLDYTPPHNATPGLNWVQENWNGEYYSYNKGI